MSSSEKIILQCLLTTQKTQKASSAPPKGWTLTPCKLVSRSLPLVPHTLPVPCKKKKRFATSILSHNQHKIWKEGEVRVERSTRWAAVHVKHEKSGRVEPESIDGRYLEADELLNILAQREDEFETEKRLVQIQYDDQSIVPPGGVVRKAGGLAGPAALKKFKKPDAVKPPPPDLARFDGHRDGYLGGHGPYRGPERTSWANGAPSPHRGQRQDEHGRNIGCGEDALVASWFSDCPTELPAPSAGAHSRGEHSPESTHSARSLDARSEVWAHAHPAAAPIALESALRQRSPYEGPETGVNFVPGSELPRARYHLGEDSSRPFTTSDESFSRGFREGDLSCSRHHRRDDPRSHDDLGGSRFLNDQPRNGPNGLQPEHDTCDGLGGPEFPSSAHSYYQNAGVDSTASRFHAQRSFQDRSSTAPGASLDGSSSSLGRQGAWHESDHGYSNQSSHTGIGGSGIPASSVQLPDSSPRRSDGSDSSDWLCDCGVYCSSAYHICEICGTPRPRPLVSAATSKIPAAAADQPTSWQWHQDEEPASGSFSNWEQEQRNQEQAQSVANLEHLPGNHISTTQQSDHPVQLNWGVHDGGSDDGEYFLDDLLGGDDGVPSKHKSPPRNQLQHGKLQPARTNISGNGDTPSFLLREDKSGGSSSESDA